MTAKEFQQIDWDDQLRADLGELLKLAIWEDLGEAGDLTTRALVPEDATGAAALVARQPGVLAGTQAVEMVLHEMEPRLRLQAEAEDGQRLQAGQRIGRIQGPARGILAAERLVLNLIGRLSGIATLTRQYVEAIAGTKARIYDTRKTTPGWRRLEKYAVRCGGGFNHRTGLFDGVLIKDNHLALGEPSTSADPPAGSGGYTPSEAVALARRFLRNVIPRAACPAAIVEVEVDTLRQLDEVLPAGPDIVLLDNFTPDGLRQAVARRDACNPAVELEASGAVDLQTVAQVAASGVDRISVGALTHAAVSLDIGLDWLGLNVAKR